MSIKQITTVDNEPFLRQISKPIDFANNDDIKEMNETAKNFKRVLF